MESRTAMLLRRWSCWRRSLVAVSTALSAACGTGDEASLPPDITDPTSVQTPAGAMDFYRHTVGRLPALLDWVVVDMALVTDEMAALAMPVPQVVGYTAIDSRSDLSRGAAVHYDSLHRLRAQAREARGFLAKYAPDSSSALRAHLYALEGYADIYLADLFCSGMPLSTVDFEGDYTLTSGLSTTEVYRHAVALFDTAVGLATDSAAIQSFAAIGRGRALLALGQYGDAAASTSGVPSGYTYQVVYSEPPGPTGTGRHLSEAFQLFTREYDDPLNNGVGGGTPSVANREGVNGLDFASSGDPRTAVELLGQDARGYNMYLPAKYARDGVVTFTVASGIEARLIEAEAALRANASDGGWLTTLNALRQTVGLSDTTDPGTEEGRVDLLFRERAFWLFMTAHRQGDLRRLVRQYTRPIASVYPTGVYPGGSGGYGNEIVFLVPESERQLNPKYTGCINRNA